MKYMIGLLLLVPGYYTFTYAIYLWKKHNKLGAFGAILIDLVGTIMSIVEIWIKL